MASKSITIVKPEKEKNPIQDLISKGSNKSGMSGKEKFEKVAADFKYKKLGDKNLSNDK